MIDLLSTYLISLGVREGVKAVVNAVGNSADLPGIVDKIIGGIVGNNVNDGLRYTIAHVRQRMQQGGEAVNHDLQKAVRKAHLLASLGLCEAFWQESGVASNFWRRDLAHLRREDVKWVDNLHDRLRCHHDHIVNRCPRNQLYSCSHRFQTKDAIRSSPSCEA